METPKKKSVNETVMVYDDILDQQIVLDLPQDDAAERLRVVNDALVQHDAAFKRNVENLHHLATELNLQEALRCSMHQTDGECPLGPCEWRKSPTNSVWSNQLRRGRCVPRVDEDEFKRLMSMASPGAVDSVRKYQGGTARSPPAVDVLQNLKRLQPQLSVELDELRIHAQRMMERIPGVLSDSQHFKALRVPAAADGVRARKDYQTELLAMFMNEQRLLNARNAVELGLKEITAFLAGLSPPLLKIAQRWSAEHPSGGYKYIVDEMKEVKAECEEALAALEEKAREVRWQPMTRPEVSARLLSQRAVDTTAAQACPGRSNRPRSGR